MSIKNFDQSCKQCYEELNMIILILVAGELYEELNMSILILVACEFSSKRKFAISFQNETTSVPLSVP